MVEGSDQYSLTRSAATMLDMVVDILQGTTWSEGGQERQDEGVSDSPVLLWQVVASQSGRTEHSDQRQFDQLRCYVAEFVSDRKIVNLVGIVFV